MFEIRCSLRTVWRNKKRSLVTIVVSIILILFLLYYVFLLNANEYKINNIYDTTDVVVKIIRKDKSTVTKQIPYLYMFKFIEICEMFDYKYYTADYQCTLAPEGLHNIEDLLTITMTTDITREILEKEFNADITYANGYDESLFSTSTKNTCIVSRNIMEKYNLKLGESFKIYAPYKKLIKENKHDMILAGFYDINKVSKYEKYNKNEYQNAIYCALKPFSETVPYLYYTDSNKEVQQPIVSEAEYLLKDSRDVEKFKKFLRNKTSFYSDSPLDPLLNPITIKICDDELKQMLGSVQSITTFMKIALPFILIIIGTIIFGVSYLMTQNRITDIALMRAMGLKTLKIYINIMYEMVIQSLIGILIGAIVCSLVYPIIFEVLPSILYITSIYILYLIIYVVGATIALSIILRMKPITVLTKKE